MRISVEYGLTANSWSVRVVSSDAGVLSTSQSQAPLETKFFDVSVTHPLSGLRVGGDIRAPKKIADVPPVYPAAAQEARVQGIVILEVRIDEHGDISDTRLLRSIPLLDAAAIDAVRQWKYEPTLLNGSAVPVVMTVTTNFTLRDLMDLQIALPNADTARLSVVAGRLASLKVAGGPGFQIKAWRQWGSDVVTVSVYAEDGRTHLGDVLVEANGAAVPLPTVPAVELRLLGIR
jgi:TonB family protein